MSESSSIAQKVDTQARVIRSLNLIHCADTQHMVGAVELERLLNLETSNRELVQRMKDDGEYICTLSERCERYRDALLKHKAENQHLTDKIHQLYEGAEEQKQRIQSLIEERDRANRLAEWKWNLRGEFESLLGTDNIEEGIKAVKEMKYRIQRLEELGKELRECARQLGWTSSDDSRWIERAEAAVKAWDKAKEDKP